MTRNCNYEIDHIEAKIILTKKFAKAASILNTPEYQELMQLRSDNPGYTMELRKITKKDGKKSYRNLTYARMEDYIIIRDGKDSEMHKEFKNVVRLSKIQAGPYAYVKTWFLNKYEDAFKNEAEEIAAPSAKTNLKLVSNN